MARTWWLGVLLATVMGCVPLPLTPGASRQRDDEQSPTAPNLDGYETRGAHRATQPSDGASASTPTTALEAANRMYARRIGLVVGIDAYRDGIPPLRSAVSDAKSFADGLRTLGFDVVYEFYDSDAKQGDIVGFLTQATKGTIGPNDLFVVYFAGHGVLGQDGESYLLPADSTTDIMGTGLSMQYLKEAALGLEARSVLYLVDACLSGTMMQKRQRSPQRVPSEYWRQARRRRVVQVVTAGTANESALESVREGLFTAAIRDGLLEGHADIDGDRVITTEELGAYAAQRVIADSGGRQHPQWGTVEGSGTIMMYDLRHIPEAARSHLPSMPKEMLPGLTDELERVHDLMDKKLWDNAESVLRGLSRRYGHSELYLLLAEVYLGKGLDQPGAFKNQALVERELANAEARPLTGGQKARTFEIRRLLKLTVRGGY